MPKKGSKKAHSVSAQLVHEVAAAMMAMKLPSAAGSATPKRARRRRRRQGGQATALPSGGVVKNPGVAPVTVTGEDFLEDIGVDARTEDGAVLLTLPLHPPSWSGTHAASLLRSYERYRLRDLEVLVSTRASKVIGGGYLAGCSPDASRGLVGGKGASRQAKAAVKAMPGSVSAPLSESVRVVMQPGNNPQVWRYTDSGGEVDIESYGNFYLVVDGAPNFVTGLNAATLSINLKWRLELASPTTGAKSSGALVAMVPKNQTVAKAAESEFCVDPYHPLNGYWARMAETFNFGSVIAISPPLTTKFKQHDKGGSADKVAGFARISWHSQRDQLRVFFYESYADAEDDAEPGPEGGKTALNLDGATVSSTHDTYFSEVASRWKSSGFRRAPPGGQARLLVDARAGRLERQGEDVISGLQRVWESLGTLQAITTDIFRHVEQTPYGTPFSPLYTVPVPIASRGTGPEGEPPLPSPSASSLTAGFEFLNG